MATSAGEVEVKLTLNAEDFKRLMGETQQQIQGFGNSLETLQTRLLQAFSFAAIADFFKSSLTAYGEQQLSIAKLVATLGAHNQATEENVSHLEAQSKALEALSGIQQDNITNAQTMLATYGLQGDMLDKATRAAVNFAIRTGSLETATNLLARAYEGNTSMLSRYGLKVDQTIDSAQQFQGLLDKINTQFGPVATAQAGTFTGQMNALGNAFKHLEETIGQFLSGPAGQVIRWFTSLIGSMTDSLAASAKNSNGFMFLANVLGTIVINTFMTFERTLMGVIAQLVSTLSKLPLVGSAFTAMSSTIDQANKGLDIQARLLKAALDASTNNTEGVIANEEQKKTAYVNTAKTAMDADTVMTTWIANHRMMDQQQFEASLKERDKEYLVFINSFVTTAGDVWKELTHLSDTFMQGVGDGVAKMVVEGKSFSESMKALFKDLAEQIISYLVQVIAKLLVVKALESSMGLGGFGPSVFQTGMGAFAEGGIIQEPSVIVGLKSGSRTLAGEAGPEMVTPMNGGQSSGGGQPITINIQGQFLEADSATWNKLMRDQIIPQIRRFTMISSTGPFNRTRGVV